MLPVIKHFRNYLSAGLIGSLLGLISFPLMTRSLSVEDYGLLGLVMATVTLFVSLCKLGLQSAVVRFFSEAQTKGAAAFHQFMSNIVGALCVMSVLGIALWLTYVHVVLPFIDETPLLRLLFLLATALIPLKIIQSLLSNILQADQKSGTISTITVLEKLFRLLCMLAIVFAIGLSSERALKVIISSEVLFLIALLVACRSYLFKATPKLEFAILTPLVAYGVPAMIGELAAVLLETGDRYVIQAYMGSESLGQYAAAVNICMYLEWVLILALQSAIVPHYVKLYEEKGRVATQEFLNNAFSLYIVIAVGVFAVFCVAAPKLIIILAGEKYSDGLIVIPWFAAGYVLVGAISIAAAGVYIDKRTKLLVKWTIIAFTVNMILNLISIPKFGLIAAAIATFIAMCIRTFGIWRDASKTLPVTFPWRRAGQAIAGAIPAYFAGNAVSTQYLVIDMFLGSAIAVTVYLSVTLAMDSELRETAFYRIKKMANR